MFILETLVFKIYFDVQDKFYSINFEVQAGELISSNSKILFSQNYHKFKY